MFAARNNIPSSPPVIRPLCRCEHRAASELCSERAAIEQPRNWERYAFHGTYVSTRALLLDSLFETPSEACSQFKVTIYRYAFLDRFGQNRCSRDTTRNETSRVHVVGASTWIPWNHLSTKHPHFTTSHRKIAR